MPTMTAAWTSRIPSPPWGTCSWGRTGSRPPPALRVATRHRTSSAAGEASERERGAAACSLLLLHHLDLGEGREELKALADIDVPAEHPGPRRTEPEVPRPLVLHDHGHRELLSQAHLQGAFERDHDSLRVLAQVPEEEIAGHRGDRR